MYIFGTIWKEFVGIKNKNSWNDRPLKRNRVEATAGLCWKKIHSLYVFRQICICFKITFWDQSINCSIKTSKRNTTTILISLSLYLCLIIRRPIPRGQPSSIWCALNATCSANLCKYLPNILVDVSPNINITSNKWNFCHSHKIFAYIYKQSLWPIDNYKYLSIHQHKMFLPANDCKYQPRIKIGHTHDI